MWYYAMKHGFSYINMEALCKPNNSISSQSMEGEKLTKLVCECKETFLKDS